MKKRICAAALAVLAAMLLASCGTGQTNDSAAPAAGPAAERAGSPSADVGQTWTREGFFVDADGNFLSVTASDDPEYTDRYVGVVLGEESYGWYVPEQDGALHGAITGVDGSEITVTVSEENDGLELKVEGGKTYHFTPLA